MKKEYKKPNICAVFFDVLDLIHTSDGESVEGMSGDDDEWGEFGGLSSGFDNRGF